MSRHTLVVSTKFIQKYREKSYLNIANASCRLTFIRTKNILNLGIQFFKTANRSL